MSELHEKLPSEVSDKLAACIDNNFALSSSLRNEVVALKESVKNYEQAQGVLKQDITAVTDVVKRDNNTLLVMKAQLDKLPEHFPRQLESKESAEIAGKIKNSQMSSKLEQLVVEQSRELTTFYGSLNTIADCYKTPRFESSGELSLSSKRVFSELRGTFARW